jgi:peptide/nickel transport system substrate-binding protein
VLFRSLPAVYAAFPHALRFLPILPEHVLRDIKPGQLRENSFSSAPIGSGPFTLRLLQNIDPATGRKIVHLNQNPQYYRGAPKLDRIQLHVYNNTDSILRALATSEVNAASDLPVLTAREVNTERYIVDNDPVNSGVYAILNTASAKLNDVKVRRALQLATNTQAVRDAISEDLPPLDLPFVSDQLSGNVPKAAQTNTQQAAALLTEAGWLLDGSTRKKGGETLTLNVVTTKNPDFEKALEVLKGQWQELGVTVTTSIVDPKDPVQNVAQDVLQQRRFDVLLYQLSIGGDADVYAYWHSSQASSGFNFSNYKNAISDEAVSSARARLEPDLRNAKYITFANQWLNDVPAIGLYQSTAQYIHTNTGHATPPNVNLNSAIDRYNSVRYWTVGERSVFKTP